VKGRDRGAIAGGYGATIVLSPVLAWQAEQCQPRTTAAIGVLQ
jgi:hypothetical protein